MRISITTESDIESILNKLDGLRGETCSEARLTYGDELNLHFGPMTPYEYSAVSHLKKGKWVLGTRESEWELKSKNKVIVTSKDPVSEIENKIRSLQHHKVEDIRIEFPDLILSIGFESTKRLLIHSIGSDDSSEISAWEVFTPKSMILELWPDRTWSYQRSDN